MGFASSLAALIVLHVLQPELPPASSPLGAYVLGTGWLATLPLYLGLALALAAAAIGGFQTLESGSLRVLAGLCFGVGALAMAVAGVFPADGAVPPSPPGSLDAWIHLGATLVALPCLFLGPLAFTLGTRGDERWDPVRWGLTTAVVGLGGAVGFLTLWAIPSGLSGAAERSLLGLLLLWLLLAGNRIRTLRRPVTGGPAAPISMPARAARSGQGPPAEEA